MLPSRTSKKKDLTGHDYIEIVGAHEHNLQNITLRIPRNQLVVITGVSGSGKSSLAFDTIYAEGQRRYMESFSSYARNFIGHFERPKAEKINGLSPVISIEQKTSSRNPRSTVGTTTEIYDFMRLLFARAGEAYSFLSGEKMQAQSGQQIVDTLFAQYRHKKISLFAPLVRGRKGSYRELFLRIRKQGYNRAWVDGELLEIKPKMQVDRFKTHDIEILIDRFVVNDKDQTRITHSVDTALKEGKNTIRISEEDGTRRFFSKNLMDMKTGLSYVNPAPNNFSFNSPYGACPTCNGVGRVEKIDLQSIISDKNLSIREGAIAPLGEYRDIMIFKQIKTILQRNGLNLDDPIKKIPEPIVKEILYGSEESLPVPSRADPRRTWNIKFDGIINFLQKQRKEGSAPMRKWVEEYVITKVCPECQGTRLKKESLYFKIDNMNIADLSSLNITALKEWFRNVEERLNAKQRIIAKQIVKEIRKRVALLLDVGLDYLTLDRSLSTLSGGEAQRIRLATQIGTQLVNVLYILDEPSIGLHARDNNKLIDALRKLRDLGNSIIVVEHDRDMMLASDHIIDIGPGAGKLGGHVVNQGEPKKFLKKNSLTSSYLTGKSNVTNGRKRRRADAQKQLILKGACGHNLKNITLTIPLGTFVCVTGVSGSGKSTVIYNTLLPLLKRVFYNSKTKPLPYAEITGTEFLNKVIEVNQSPIGRTPRSNPATYTEVFTDIRNLYSRLPEAKIRGYNQGRFSFNVQGGRCETCQGAGKQLIEMVFLPSIHISCETCRGLRYNKKTLEIRFKNKSISDVLNMTVEEAVLFFEKHPRILRKLQILNEVGLGYITLGQHATTLSGGEAQRVKLATELSKRDTGKTIYILDEPTTGLHFNDISHLLKILQRLVDKGNTILVIEHNMDIIKSADHIVDLGLEGGEKGGEIVVFGTPEEVASEKKGYTSRYLKEELLSVKDH